MAQIPLPILQSLQNEFWMQALQTWILQSSSRSCWSSHLSPVPWKCVCAFVHVSWTSQMTLRFSTDFWAKAASWLAPNLRSFWMYVFCECFTWQGLRNVSSLEWRWSGWMSSKCLQLTDVSELMWHVGLGGRCQANMSLCHTMDASMLLSCPSKLVLVHCPSNVPYPCNWIVFSDISMTHGTKSFQSCLIFVWYNCLRCCQSPAEPSLWNETSTSRSLFAACWHGGVCLCKCHGQLWDPEQGPWGISNVWSICPKSDTGLRTQMSQCLQMSEWIASHVSDLLSLICLKLSDLTNVSLSHFSIVPTNMSHIIVLILCVEEVWFCCVAFLLGLCKWLDIWVFAFVLLTLVWDDTCLEWWWDVSSVSQQWVIGFKDAKATCVKTMKIASRSDSES